MSFTLSSAIESGALTLADVVFGYRGGFITKMVCEPHPAHHRQLEADGHFPADVLDINCYTKEACLRGTSG